MVSDDSQAEACFSIAGFEFSVRCREPSVLPVVTRGWREFQGGNGGRTAAEISITTTPRFGGVERNFPVLSRQPDGAFVVRGEDYEADVSADLRTVQIRQPADAFPTSAVMKLVLGADLLTRGGVLVHGVSVADSGKAALFSGESGAGKSTLGALGSAAGLSRLSDELVAVFTEPGGARAMGTPWNIGVPQGAALVAAGVLGWADHSTFESVTPTEVLRVLSTNTLFPDESTQTRHQVFAVLANVLQQVRTGRFVFARDDSAAAALRALLAT